jgi:hypothetical protein
MFEGLINVLTGTDVVIRSMKTGDRESFTKAFLHSTIFFLRVPPGCENGFDLFTSQEEMLAHIRAGAKDLSQRTQFTPFCRTHGGHKSLLLFTRHEHAGDFACAFVRETRRVWQFQVLGVKGDAALRLFDIADSVVFNPLTKQEAELPIELLNELKAAATSQGRPLRPA